MGFVWGYVREDYVAEATLAIRVPHIETTLASVPLIQSSEFFFQKLVQELKSTNCLYDVAAYTMLPVSAEALAHQSQVRADTNSATIRIRMRASYPEMALRLAGAYAVQGLQRCRVFWERERQAMQDSIERQLTTVEAELAALDQRRADLQPTDTVFDVDKGLSEATDRSSQLDVRIANLKDELDVNQARLRVLSDELGRQNPAVVAAKEALVQALSQFTEEHPKVKALRRALAEREAHAAAETVPTNLDGVPLGSELATNLYVRVVNLRAENAALEKELERAQRAEAQARERSSELRRLHAEYAGIDSRYQSLKRARDTLVEQRRETLLLQNHGAAYTDILEPARLTSSAQHAKWEAACVWGAGSGVIGGFVVLMGLLFSEGSKRTIRGQEDLQEATGLPVLAALSNLNEMSPRDQERWAVQTLSVLKANLCNGEERALICGFTSSQPGEGKSTWIRLLAEAASRQGYNVAVLAQDAQRLCADRGIDLAADDDGLIPSERAAQILGAIMTTETRSPVRIPLAGWIWDWQHRQQFRQALSSLRMIENLAILIDVPAYSTAEGVLLAEEAPNLIWLSRRDAVSETKIRGDAEALRRSHCAVVGAVLNHVPNGHRRPVTAPWACALLCAFCLVATSLSAAQNEKTPAAGSSPIDHHAHQSLSVSSPDHLAAWQRHLTLGPGDVLEVRLYGEADSGRTVTIGPDGRVEYLQAHEFMASGLTVDELRAGLEKVLSKYHLAPQVVINPTAYRSKKYYLIGNVQQKGIYLLDRPTTVIEAIAKGKGFVAAVQYQNVAMMVDLAHSFLMRKKPDGSFAPLKVDFEALFRRGDLSQNIPLAPDDYLFFPPLGPQEVYVLGEVRGPGVMPFTTELTALGAIAGRGGFTERAWKGKVLVIRGSLQNPEPFVVNMDDILHARGKDFRLVSRDIVYVARKPWAKAEELLESAITDFATAAIIGYTGRNVGPFIKEPIIK